MPALLLAAFLAAPLGLHAPLEPEPDQLEIGAPELEPARFGAGSIIMQPATFGMPPPPPPDGSGRLVGGSVAIALGLGAAATVIVEHTREGGNPGFVAATFIPISLASIGLGAYLLVRGAKARRNFNDWQAQTTTAARPSGDGLIVGGTISVAIGALALFAAAGQAARPNAFDRPLAPTLLGVGVTGVAFGVGALTGGMLRRDKYRRWREETFLGRTGLTPTITPLYATQAGAPPLAGLHGASFGFVGRL